MSPRERVLAAISHRPPDKVPKTAEFTPAVMQTFREKTGSNNPEEYFGMEPREVRFSPTVAKNDFSPYLGSLPPGTEITEFGVAHIAGNFYHFTKMVHPLRNMREANELLAYPWPDLPADYRHRDLESRVQALHDQGWFVSAWVGHIFEIAWYMRGMEQLFLDFLDNPEFAGVLLDKITQYNCFIARRMAEAGVDMLSMGDDVGMQRSLMMKPETWRRWLKPRLAQVIAAGRAVNPKIPAFYHSDGNILSIIPEIIEAGVTVLNPVQPECMDPVALKEQYGEALAFWGTIGTQTTMPFGTPEEVERTVRERIETIGKGGGLVLAPTHTLEPDVPWENILALFNAVEKYGGFR
jgi:uroporphyrinogen decarboxylase